MRKKGIVQGALILTGANIITRILGFIYRIYMANIIGAEGMGLYQLIAPLYMLVWSLSSSGFSTAVSKFTAQENAKGEYGNIKRVLNISIAISIAIAAFCTVFMFLFAEYIGIYFLKDERTVFSLKIMSLCFVFMAAGSCIRGYFFGLQETAVPALSQVLEQIARMSVIYFLGSLFIPHGIEYACAAAVIGMCAGEILSFVYVYAVYHRLIHQRTVKPAKISHPAAISVILTMAIPLTANRVTGSLLSAIENVLIPQKLQACGLSAEKAMAAFGELNAMAMPLIMFPSSLLTALSIALVPAVSEARAIKNIRRIKLTSSRSMLFTAIIGIGAGGLFITYSSELALAFYNQAGVGDLLYMLGFVCPLLYFQVTLSGILNGLGEQLFIFKNSLIASSINISFIYFFIPYYGIKAYITGWFLGQLIVCLLALKRVFARTAMDIDLKNWLCKPIIAMSFSCLFSRLFFRRISEGRLSNLSELIMGCSLAAVTYIIILLATECLELKDLKDVLSSL